jgi:hypothetical protein
LCLGPRAGVCSSQTIATVRNRDCLSPLACVVALPDKWNLNWFTITLPKNNCLWVATSASLITVESAICEPRGGRVLGQHRTLVSGPLVASPRWPMLLAAEVAVVALRPMQFWRVGRVELLARPCAPHRANLSPQASAAPLRLRWPAAYRLPHHPSGFSRRGIPTHAWRTVRCPVRESPRRSSILYHSSSGRSP